MTYELEIIVIDAKGVARPIAGSISINAPDPDAALEKARAQIAKKNLPPVRTLNFTPAKKIVAYCGDKPQRPTAEGERRVWKRPPGPAKEL